jgi:hypothetical protein
MAISQNGSRSRFLNGFGELFLPLSILMPRSPTVSRQKIAFISKHHSLEIKPPDQKSADSELCINRDGYRARTKVLQIS